MASPNFDDVTKIGWETSPETSCVLPKRLSCILFLASGSKIVNKSCFMTIFKVQTVLFAPISRPDKHAELLKIYFTPLVKKLKFSTSVAKSDLRFKVH